MRDFTRRSPSYRSLRGVASAARLPETDLMRFMIMGSGMQGRGCAFDMLRNPSVREILLVDASDKALERARDFLGDDRVRTARADAADVRRVRTLARHYDVLVSAAPYFFNLRLAKAAIAAKTHFLDLGGNTEIVRKELALNRDARRAGVAVQPDVGLAPGMANTLGAHGISMMDRADEALMRVGGLPQDPVPPMNYTLVFSEHGLINEYVEPAMALRDGRRVFLPGLSEIETIHFPKPLGRCRAAHAYGGLATMAYTYAGKVRHMDYKVIRYPGHFAVINGMNAMGFFDKKEVQVGSAVLTPRAMSARLFRRHFLRPGDKDIVALRVIVRGRKGRRRMEVVYDMIDKHDDRTGLSAMMRTTGFPASIVAQMMVRGLVRPGAHPIEKGVPPEPFIQEARKRGFKIRQTVRTIRRKKRR